MSKVLCFRLTDIDLARLDGLSASAGITRSAFIRASLQGETPEPSHAAALSSLYAIALDLERLGMGELAERVRGIAEGI